MGWASGSGIAQDLWKDIKGILTPEQRKKVKKAIIENFEAADCDTMDEVDWN